MARTRTWMQWIIGSDGAATAATNGVHEEYDYLAVDTSTDSTTVYAGPAVLKGVYVNTALSAHTVVMKDGSATVLTIPASAAAGDMFTFPGILCATSLVCDPDNSSTGNITVVYKPL